MTTSFAIDTPLDALPLIQEEHRAAVIAHPEWRTVATGRDPAMQLAWMVRQRLLTYDELDNLLTFDEDAAASDRIIEEAFAELGREHARVNCSLLDQLRLDQG